MNKLYTVEALILRARDFGEADKVITLFSREEGKSQAVAKGVRKPTSRLRGGVQTFSHTRLLLFRGKNLDTVSQSETIDAFPRLHQDLTSLAAVSCLADLLETALPEREAQAEIFQLALNVISLLGQGDPELVLRFFELRLLDLLGYRPSFSACSQCGCSLEGGIFYFDPEVGGLLCRSCVQEPQRLPRLSPGTALALERMLDGNLSRLKVSPSARREMDTVLGFYLEHLLERKLKARTFFRQMLDSGQNCP
jgi:DNA repair protein RecO (recombination protein O)